MSTPYTAEHVTGLVIERCETNGIPLNCKKLQAIMYFVQTQFIMEDDVPCFKDSIYVDKAGGLYINEIQNRLQDYPTGKIPFDVLKKRFPVSKRLDPHSMAVMNRAVDAAASLPEKELIKIASNQLPYRRAFVSESKKISIGDIRKFFEKP